MVIGRLAEIQFRSLNWCKCSIWPEYVGRECEKSEFCTEGIKQYRIQKAWPNGLTPNPLFGQWFAISVKILGDFSLNCYKVKVKVKTPQLKVKLSFRCFFLQWGVSSVPPLLPTPPHLAKHQTLGLFCILPQLGGEFIEFAAVMVQIKSIPSQTWPKSLSVKLKCIFKVATQYPEMHINGPTSANF